MPRASVLPFVAAALIVTACSPTTSPSTTAPSSVAAAGTATPSTTTAAAPGGGGEGPLVARGRLVDPAGASVGTVELLEVTGGMQVSVQAAGLTPGFHGAHLHTVGKCEPNSADPSDPALRGNFNSSGGHLNPGAGEHPNHDGDLPVLLASGNGQASLVAVTNRLTRERLADLDGTAFVVHERPDNYANIPTRYASASADAETKKAGDAGPRVACAILTGTP